MDAGGEPGRPAIGFVGLGNMGAPMCHRLLGRGYAVYIYDVDPDAIGRFDRTGARPASSLSELATESDTILLSLPGSEVVEKVILGEEGLAGGLSAGQTIIDMSSSRPLSTQMLAARLAQRRVSMLDAPVSGGVPRAREGTLAIMVGGDKEVFERQLDLLNSFGEKIFYMGEHGTGHLAKALNNLLSATTLVSASEAVLLGIEGGLDPHTLIDVINVSTGRSNSTESKFPHYILPRTFDAGFTTRFYNKDVRTALETAAEYDFPMAVGSAVGRIWQKAVDEGYGPKDHTEIYAFLEELVRRRGESPG
jgi:3-hydroxyisobutyrate dehydrogenase